MSSYSSALHCIYHIPCDHGGSGESWGRHQSSGRACRSSRLSLPCSRRSGRLAGVLHLGLRCPGDLPRRRCMPAHLLPGWRQEHQGQLAPSMGGHVPPGRLCGHGQPLRPVRHLVHPASPSISADIGLRSRRCRAGKNESLSRAKSI